MKILVTGGAGFIGSHIVDKLLELGHEVAIVDDLSTGKKENLNSKAAFFQVDIRNKEELAEVFRKASPEVVYHNAAHIEARSSVEDPEHDASINVIGSINVIKSSLDCNVRKVIYASSGGTVYGDVDESEFPIKEDTPSTSPSSAYGISKRVVEDYLKLYQKYNGLTWTSLRYPNVFGPRQEGNAEAGVIAIFTSKMLRGKTPIINGDGLYRRDYTYVSDIVDANIAALGKGDNDAFNLGTGVETTTVEVFEAIESILKTGIKPTFGPEKAGDVRRNVLDVSKARGILGWSPKYNLTTGLKETIDFYKKLAI